MGKSLKIVADEAIPFLDGVFDPWADTIRRPGREIGPRDVDGADALIVRTRTRCGEELLRDSSVRLIATATIGFDHIDLAYCRRRGIRVATAAGCNARGVLQWVAGVLAHLARRQDWRPEERTLGIVGVGHVGALVKRYAESWGFRVLCCDPPREERERLGFLPLDEVARRSDLITFHTPLDDSTRHLCDERLLGLLPGSHGHQLFARRGGLGRGPSAERSSLCARCLGARAQARRRTAGRGRGGYHPYCRLLAARQGDRFGFERAGRGRVFLASAVGVVSGRRSPRVPARSAGKSSAAPSTPHSTAGARRSV